MTSCTVWKLRNSNSKYKTCRCFNSAFAIAVFDYGKLFVLDSMINIKIRAVRIKESVLSLCVLKIYVWLHLTVSLRYFLERVMLAHFSNCTLQLLNLFRKKWTIRFYAVLSQYNQCRVYQAAWALLSLQERYFCKRWVYYSRFLCGCSWNGSSRILLVEKLRITDFRLKKFFFPFFCSILGVLYCRPDSVYADSICWVPANQDKRTYGCSRYCSHCTVVTSCHMNVVKTSELGRKFTLI